MAELTINTADITAALQKNLEGFSPELEMSQVGRVLEVGDGIATVSGLPDCAVNELLAFEHDTVGLALNLDEDTIGAVILGVSEKVAAIEEGSTVRATGQILSVPVGDAMLGRVVNALGEPIEQRACLQKAATLGRAQRKRIRPVRNRFLVGVRNQLHADGFAELVAKRDHLAEFVGGVDVQKRKRNLAGVEGLLRQADHDGGVFADRIQHDRTLKLGYHLTHDVDGFGLQGAQMR